MTAPRRYLTFASNKRLPELVIILFLGMITLYAAWLYRNFAQDDAFITYRYARNIVNGYGFVYNLDEPILGTTTPLYTLILALFGKLTGQDIYLISHLVSVFCLWLSSVILYYLGRDQGEWVAAAIALIFITNPLLMTAIGMETFFLIAMMLLALKSYQANSLKVTGVLLGLLMLTRYETALFAGVLGIHFMVKRRRLPFWLILTGVIFLAWMAFAWTTFGHVIPRSAVAKLAEDEGFPFAIGAVFWWRVYALQSVWYYALIPLLLFGIYAAVRNKTKNLAYRLILIWSVIYFTAAGFIAGTFSWYYGPLIPGLAILLGWGTEWLVDRLSGIVDKTAIPGRTWLPPSNSPLWGENQPTSPPLGGIEGGLSAKTEITVEKSSFIKQSGSNFRIGILGLITISIITFQLSSWHKGWVNYQGQIVDERYVYYQQVAQWLNRHAEQNASLATSEIGVVGYYTNTMRMVDLYGLVTPGLIPWLTANRVDMLAKAIELYAPDYLLINEKELNEFLQSSSNYQLVKQFDEGAYTLYTKR